jgi:hypothetical protein
MGLVIPEDLESPHILVWEPGVDGAPLGPVWIVVDRLITLPEALT